MTQQTWDQIELLWKQASQVPSHQREAFVKNAVNIEEEVRREVLAMLRQDDHSEDFLETPAMEEAARHLAQEKLNAPTLEMKGQRYGDYEIISELGVGGMGIVYLARDLHLRRAVALKILPELFVRDADRVKRFRREAEMLARVNHPNVATLFDYDRNSADAPRFLVMEYVEGETLAERLERGKLTAAEAAPLFRQIAEALQSAHAQGIIHRDLKPSNIKITPVGTVKVLDFGLAKLAPAAGAEPSVVSSNGTRAQMQTLTQPQMILGTPGYMSPEQVRGDKDLDQRADWWAFGCLLYEALSGRNPFRADSNADTQAAILHKEPDWKTLPPQTPPALVRLIHRCLAKDLSQRVRNASEVLPLLQNVKDASGLTLVAIRLQRAAPQLGLAAACIALLLGVYVGYLWLKPRPLTVLAVIAEPEAAPCEAGRSEAIAKLVNDKLREFRGVQIVNHLASERSQPFLMIDADLTQAALTAEANTVLKVAATDCTDGRMNIKYSLQSKQGKSLAKGTATDLGQVLLSVVKTLNLQGNAADLQVSETDKDYYRALTLLSLYANEDAINTAIELLKGLTPSGQKEEARRNAALGRAYDLKYNFSSKAEFNEWAASSCEKAKVFDGNDPEVLLLCAEVAISHSNFPRAIADFEKVIQEQGNDYRAILGLAKANEYKKDYAKAEEYYLKAVSLRSDSWEIYNELGGFYFAQGNFQKAEEHWLKVTQLLDSNPCGFNNLGLALLYQEKYEPATAMYYEARKRKPLPATYHNLGVTYLFQGICERAVEEFRKGKKLDPEDPEFWGAEGDALSCGTTQQKDALQAYDQAITMLTSREIAGDANYLSLLAEWYARKNDKKLALEKIDEALRLDPENYDCIISAIKVFKLTNEPDRLMPLFEKAVQHRKSLFEVKHDPLLKELLQQEKYRKLTEQ